MSRSMVCHFVVGLAISLQCVAVEKNSVTPQEGEEWARQHWEAYLRLHVGNDSEWYKEIGRDRFVYAIRVRINEAFGGTETCVSAWLDGDYGVVRSRIVRFPCKNMLSQMIAGYLVDPASDEATVFGRIRLEEIELTKEQAGCLDAQMKQLGKLTISVVPKGVWLNDPTVYLIQIEAPVDHYELFVCGPWRKKVPPSYPDQMLLWCQELESILPPPPCK